MYSKEDGTSAAKLPDQVHCMTKKSRLGRIMSIQKGISKANLERKIWNVYDVLLENVSFDGKYYIGRTYMDVPEEDGVIFVKKTEELEFGQFVKCKIVDIKDYDLIGEII